MCTFDDSTFIAGKMRLQRGLKPWRSGPGSVCLALVWQLAAPLLAVDFDPRRVGGYDTTGSAVGVALSSHYAYVADGAAGLQVIDITNPANPQRVGGYDTTGFAQGVAVFGNYAYVADGN